MNPLRVGVGRAHITPFLGCQIDGNIGVPRPAEIMMTPLYAGALVLEQEDRRFCFLSLDLLAVTGEAAAQVRRMAAEQFSFSPQAVAIHATQCHSAPSLGQIMLSDRLPATRQYPWLRGSDPAYLPRALVGIQQAIEQAVATLEPVQVAWGFGLEERVACNRRNVMRDGTAEMGLGGRPAEMVLHVEGPIDPEVGVATFTTTDLRTRAVLLHYTCHPVHWHPHRAIHADWPGAWGDQVRVSLLPGAVPLVVNGCCGNIMHRTNLHPARKDSAPEMAALLTETTRQALHDLRPMASPRLDWRRTTVPIPYRQFPPEVFAGAQRLIDEHPQPLWKTDAPDQVDWSWCFAASLLDLQELLKTQSVFEYEIQALRIGDLALVVLMGEPFVEGQLEIKRRSPATRTFVAHMSNGYVGYIPTPQAIQRGGYETRPRMGSKLAPEALAIIADASVSLLEDLFGRGNGPGGRPQ